jgi:hypothetical protein
MRAHNNVATLIHAFLTNRQHNRIRTFKSLKRSVQTNREFIGTGAMVTDVNKPRLDLGSIELGIDLRVAVKIMIAMIYDVARVIWAQRCHPTHEDGGLHSA